MCSEFQMVKTVSDWCRRTGEATLPELLPYFDLSALTADQQHWLLQELPPSIDYAALVLNGLLRSEILQPHELASFHLDYPGMRWKRIFSVGDRLANLFEVIEKSFAEFHKKLLVLHIHERLSVAIYILQPVVIDEEALIGNSVRAFAFPHTQQQGNARERIHVTGPEYRLYYDHTTFQL
ncbi:hypothetical protein BJX70DRAFT_401951 [Aspergillus crustosus]